MGCCASGWSAIRNGSEGGFGRTSRTSTRRGINARHRSLRLRPKTRLRTRRQNSSSLITSPDERRNNARYARRTSRTHGISGSAEYARDCDPGLRRRRGSTSAPGGNIARPEFFASEFRLYLLLSVSGLIEWVASVSEPIRKVWIYSEAFAASRLSMMRIMARRMNAATVVA